MLVFLRFTPLLAACALSACARLPYSAVSPYGVHDDTAYRASHAGWAPRAAVGGFQACAHTVPAAIP